MRTSFVVTCFNQSSFIAEAIQSCLDQTVSDIEVIVVDDGSYDDSPAVIKRFLTDSRVQFCQQSNEGPSAAFNAGLARATGDYIAWLGGDDVCLPDRVERQIIFLKTTSSDVVFCVPQIIDSSGALLDAKDYPVFAKEVAPDDMLSILLFEGNFLCAPSAFMSRSVFEKLGGLKRGLIQLQDFEYWIRCLLNGMKIHRDDNAAIRYRRHSSNLSTPKSAFASSCEYAMIVGDALEHESSALAIRKVASHILSPNISGTARLSDLDKVMFLLSSTIDQVRGRGARMAINLIEQPSFRDELKNASISYPSFLTASLSNI